MSEPFVGQIAAVGFNFAPPDWALCDGRSLPITSYMNLFTVIGTTFGGDGQTTFNLPDLRGRGAVGAGQGPGLSDYDLGQSSGSEQATVTRDQIAAHRHDMTGSNSSSMSVPAPNALLGPAGAQVYAQSSAVTPLSPASVSTAPGLGLPHENRQPYQTINYIIALQGYLPPR